MRTRTPIAERFQKYVEKTPSCWNWTGWTTANGYGRIHVGGRDNHKVAVHRLAWELEHGSIPDGMNVCHHCDNPRCVRTSHLFLGTQRENLHDMIAKGRARWGNARLTLEQAREIKELSKVVSRKELAERFSVSVSTINHILTGRIWRAA